MAEENEIPDAKISADHQSVVDRFLYQSVEEYSYSRIDLCMQKGANIDTRQGQHGMTPLHRAVEMGSTALVKRLLSHRPNMFVRDKYGRMAFDLLQHVGNSTTRSEMTDLMLHALPDHIRKGASSDAEAIRRAEEEQKQQQPGRKVEGVDAPQQAAFRQKPKGFNP